MAIPEVPGANTQAAVCPPGQSLESGTGLCTPETGMGGTGGTGGTTMPPPPGDTSTTAGGCPPGQTYFPIIGCSNHHEGAACPDGYYQYGNQCLPRDGYGGGIPGQGDGAIPAYGGDYSQPGYDGGPYTPQDTDPNNPNNPIPPASGQPCPEGYTRNVAGICERADGICIGEDGNKTDCSGTGGIPNVGQDPGNCPPGTQWSESLGYCAPYTSENPTQGVDPTTGCPTGWVMGVNGNCVDPSAVGGVGDGTGAIPPVPGDYPEPGDLPFTDSPTPTVPDEIGGVSPVDPNAQPLDYGELNPYIDAAWEEALRGIEPQEQFEDERFQQELINKGIDPNSPAGEKAYAQYKRAQADRRNSAKFEAMKFGTDIQSQMFDQSLSTSQLANNLAPYLMNLTQQGHEFDMDLLLKGDKQAWDQIMDTLGLERQDYYDWRDESRYMNAIIMALAGLAEAPTFVAGGGNSLNSLISAIS